VQGWGSLFEVRAVADGQACTVLVFLLNGTVLTHYPSWRDGKLGLAEILPMWVGNGAAYVSVGVGTFYQPDSRNGPIYRRFARSTAHVVDHLTEHLMILQTEPTQFVSSTTARLCLHTTSSRQHRIRRHRFNPRHTACENDRTSLDAPSKGYLRRPVDLATTYAAW